jgi:hypothetical protein
MDEVMKLLVKFFAQHSVAPPEVTPEDTDREKTYLVDLPERPDAVFLFRETSARQSKIVGKNVTVKRIQCIVRSRSQTTAYERIHRLYLFLLQRVAEIEELNSNHWMILDCSRGPQKHSIDEEGRHLWSLTFVMTVNLF